MYTLFHGQTEYKKGNQNGKKSCRFGGQSHVDLMFKCRDKTKSVAGTGVKISLMFNELKYRRAYLLLSKNRDEKEMTFLLFEERNQKGAIKDSGCLVNYKAISLIKGSI